MRFPIRWKLILGIGLPLVGVYLAILGFQYNAGRRTALRHTEAYLTELTFRHAARFDGEFSTCAQVARTTAMFLTAHPDFLEAELYRLLERNVAENPRVYGAAIAFEPEAFVAGRNLCGPYVCRSAGGTRSMDLGRSYDYLASDWYLIPKLLNEPVWTEPYYDVGAGNILMCTYSVPFYREGKLRGITTVDVSLEDLHPRVSALQISAGYCMIISRYGAFVSHPVKELIMCETVFSLAEWYKVPELAEVGRRVMGGERLMTRIPDFATRKPKWIVTAPIPSCGWTFAAVIPDADVMAPVYRDLRTNLTILLIGLLLIIGAIILAAIRITHPISHLAQTVGELAKGNLDTRVTGVESHDEIGELARAFNKMLIDLKTHVAALTRETAAREAVESEMRIARKIQMSLMPHLFPPFPERKEFDLHAVNVAAKEVAGDFYDFYFIANDLLVITIADVSGKGLPAALFMSATRTLIRNLASDGLEPAKVLSKANNTLARDNAECMFVTLFLAQYDTRTGRLVYANAGHNPPYCVDRAGTVRSFGRATGLVLGAMEGAEYTQGEITLAVGERLVLYTDGVTEATSRANELFGEERFEQLLSRNASASVSQLCEIVTKTIDEYQAHEQFDDITLLVLHRNE